MIVNTNTAYNSSTLKRDLDYLLFKYPFLKLYIIGYSVLGKPIYSVKLGFGSKEVCYLSSTHANEYITTTLLMKFLENVCIAYYQNSNICGYNIKKLLNMTTIYLIPLVNPDGIDLVTGNISTNSNSYLYAKYVSRKFSNVPFPSGWKANINGVDLKNYQPFFQSLVIVDITQLCISYFLDELILSALSNPSFE